NAAPGFHRDLRVPGPALARRGGPDRAGAPVAVEVDAHQRRDGLAAIDVAACDRAAARPAVAVLCDRHHRLGCGLLAGVDLRAFIRAPAVVLAAGAVCGLEVDLFPLVLPDV